MAGQGKNRLSILGKTENFLSGTKILTKVKSPINGQLEVVYSLAWGTHIKTGNITQSGGIARQIWQQPLAKISQNKVTSVLFLGLGPGATISLIKKHWPEARIVGVEIDPVMVELGKRYFYLDKQNLDIRLEDASDFVKREKNKYDLICLDTYCGDRFPRKFESVRFLESVKKLLKEKGVVIFNRLYYDAKRKEAQKFSQKLEKVFPKVEALYPEANVMYLCSF